MIVTVYDHNNLPKKDTSQSISELSALEIDLCVVLIVILSVTLIVMLCCYYQSLLQPIRIVHVLCGSARLFNF